MNSNCSLRLVSLLAGSQMVLCAQVARQPVVLKHWAAPLYWQPSLEEARLTRPGPEARLTRPGPEASAQLPVISLVFVVFSPLVVLMALIAKTPTLTEYYAGVGVCGTWSVCGVISGFGRIAGARWALRSQMLLCWFTVAAYSVVGAAMLFYGFTLGPISFGLMGAVGAILTATPFLFCARRRQRELRESLDSVMTMR